MADWGSAIGGVVQGVGSVWGAIENNKSVKIQADVQKQAYETALGAESIKAQTMREVAFYGLIAVGIIMLGLFLYKAVK